MDTFWVQPQIPRSYRGSKQVSNPEFVAQTNKDPTPRPLNHTPLSLRNDAANDQLQRPLMHYKVAAM